MEHTNLLFNEAFYLINSKVLNGNNEDYYSSIHNETTFNFKRRFTFQANIDDYKKAIVLFEQLIEIKPNCKYSFNYCGIARENCGDLYGSINDYTKALAIDPNYNTALVNRGHLKHKMKDYEEAILDYTTAIEKDDIAYDLYKARGFAKARKKDYEGAIIDFALAIDIDPFNNEDTVVPFCLRSLSQKINNSETIEDSFFEMVLLSSKYNYSARQNLRLKEFEAAIKDFSSIITHLPKEFITFQKRGIAKIKIKDFNGALDDFIKAIEIHQNNYTRRNNKLEFGLKDFAGNVDFIKYCINPALNGKVLKFIENLKHLDFRNNGISDISPLAAFTKLEYLNLGKNTIKSLKPISHFTNLTRLELGEITDEESVFELFRNSEICSISYGIENKAHNGNKWQYSSINIHRNDTNEIKIFLEATVENKLNRKFNNIELAEVKDLILKNVQQKILSLLREGEEIVSREEYIEDDFFMDGFYKYQ